jgi:hypothetical protein
VIGSYCEIAEELFPHEGIQHGELGLDERLQVAALQCERANATPQRLFVWWNNGPFDVGQFVLVSRRREPVPCVRMLDLNKPGT